MILAFDLDDTLYSELTYVHSGLLAVASFLSDQYGLSKATSYKQLLTILQCDGRGKIFDTYLDSLGLSSIQLVKRCLAVYRGHTPDISLYKETQSVLKSLSEFPHYLVTDGNKDVQYRKVCALGIESWFRRVFITHRFGVNHAKPSIYCFEKIRSAERVDWSDVVYVGDNPHKDFVNLNKVGAITIRVRTGGFGLMEAKPGFDARYSIEHIKDLPALLRDEQEL